MSHQQEKIDCCYHLLVKTLGKDSVSTVGHEKIKANCPVCCSNKKTLFFDVFGDRLICLRCKFKASPILLFVDAYCEEPTGDLLEDDIKLIAKNTKPMPEIIIRRSSDKNNNNETNRS